MRQYEPCPFWKLEWVDAEAIKISSFITSSQSGPRQYHRLEQNVPAGIES